MSEIFIKRRYNGLWPVVSSTNHYEPEPEKSPNNETDRAPSWNIVVEHFGK